MSKVKTQHKGEMPKVTYLRNFSVMVHAQVVSHLVRNHKDGLKVVALVDGAREVGVAHARHPRQSCQGYVQILCILYRELFLRLSLENYAEELF